MRLADLRVPCFMTGTGGRDRGEPGLYLNIQPTPARLSFFPLIFSILTMPPIRNSRGRRAKNAGFQREENIKRSVKGLAKKSAVNVRGSIVAFEKYQI